MTGDNDFSPSRRPSEDETQASLRAEILQQISIAQFDLEQVLLQVGPNGERMPLALQLANLSAIRQQVSVASASTLVRMQAEANAAIGAAQALAKVSAATADAGAITLATATAQARRTVEGFLDDYYEKRKFDKFLEFSSEEDERAFREREKQRQEEIKKALAEGTPEGTKQAIRLGQEQLDDAKAHGADTSPEFQAQSDALDKAERDIDRALLIAADTPSNTAQADDHLARLRKAGVTVADQSGEGHGVTMDASIAQFLARG